MKKKKSSSSVCPDCGPIQTSHAQQWAADLFYLFTPFRFVAMRPSLRYWIFSGIDRFFLRLGMTKTSSSIDLPGFPLRSKVFLQEIGSFGFSFKAVVTPWGINNQFFLERDGKSYAFEGLPRAEFIQGKLSDKIDDKVFVKNILIKNDLPVTAGRSFFYTQKKQAVNYGENFLGYPLVVKPATGSMSQHITLDIRNRRDLIEGINRATRYSPYFIVEKYIKSPFVYRANVVDKSFVAVVKRIPANVVGDGASTINELVDRKNSDPRRGPAGDQSFVLYHLKIDEVSQRLLDRQGYSLDSVPGIGEVVYLQEKVILDIGADLEEVTPFVHPDNAKLFIKVAELFGMYLVGIDFLAEDITVSWKEQECAILELNSLPYIDMHHYPSIGQPVNIGREVARMVDRYYR